jgi:2'-5' RNA ligase superfamily protein
MARMTEPKQPGCMPSQSGIILPVREVEPVVGSLRRLHDPQARYGVPAHITLLYPFAPPSRVGASVAALQELFSVTPVFEFSVVEVRRFPVTAYLHPEPSAAFVRLTEMLVQRWPEFPPYGGAFATVIPHLTVADHATAEVLDAVDLTVARHLPIACRATEAWLMCSDEDGFWSRHEVFRLKNGRGLRLR